MLGNYLPYAHEKSVFSIDYKKLLDKGYKAVIFDIDNTLVHHGDPVTPEIEQLFEDIHALGLKTFLLSNNSDERIAEFNKNIQTGYVPLADKPNTHNYVKALEMLGLNKDEVVFIGDQIFTDILGANRVGMPNILVKYIVKDPNAKIGKKRIIEKVLLKIGKLTKATDRLGNITKENS